jgi:hypothetical protein
MAQMALPSTPWGTTSRSVLVLSLELVVDGRSISAELGRRSSSSFGSIEMEGICLSTERGRNVVYKAYRTSTGIR